MMINKVGIYLTLIGLFILYLVYFGKYAIINIKCLLNIHTYIRKQRTFIPEIYIFKGSNKCFNCDNSVNIFYKIIFISYDFPVAYYSTQYSMAKGLNNIFSNEGLMVLDNLPTFIALILIKHELDICINNKVELETIEHLENIFLKCIQNPDCIIKVEE